MIAIQRDYADRGVRIVAFNSNDASRYAADSFDAMRAARRERGVQLRLPARRGPVARARARLGADAGGVPLRPRPAPRLPRRDRRQPRRGARSRRTTSATRSTPRCAATTPPIGETHARRLHGQVARVAPASRRRGSTRFLHRPFPFRPDGGMIESPRCGTPHSACCVLALCAPGSAARRHGRLGVLLPVVRDELARRRLRALGAGRPHAAVRHRVELLPGARRLLVEQHGGAQRADGGRRAGRDQRAGRLVVGEGLGRGSAAAGRDRGRRAARDRGRRAPRAVPGPERREHARRHHVPAGPRRPHLLPLPAVRPARPPTGRR